MSKVLQFADGTNIQVEDTSSATNINIKTDGFAPLADIYNKFSEANLKHVTFDGVEYNSLKLIGATAVSGTDGITMNISLRTMSDQETIMIQIAEIQEAIAELAAGGTN